MSEQLHIIQDYEITEGHLSGYDFIKEEVYNLISYLFKRSTINSQDNLWNLTLAQ